jgi:hypothetical protein
VKSLPNSLAASILSLERSGSQAEIDELARTLVAELIGIGAPIRHLHRTFKSYLLGVPSQPDPFWKRLQSFLNPVPGASRQTQTATLTRHIHFLRPADFTIGFPTRPVEGSYLERGDDEFVIQTQPYVHLASEAKEKAVEAFRLTTDTWLAYLRLAIGDGRDRRLRAIADGDVAFTGSTARYPAPDFRRLWSRANAGRCILHLIGARSWLKAEDRDRLDAAVEWVGTALLIWPESPMRAVGLLWMALETLFGDVHSVYTDGTRLLLRRLPLELASEAKRYITRLAAVGDSAWATSAQTLQPAEPLRGYLARIYPTIPEAEAAFRYRLAGVLELFASPDARMRERARYTRDLRFLYAVRNGMAHGGRAEISQWLAVYLLNVGTEVFKSAITALLSTHSRQATPRDKEVSLTQAWSRAHDRAKSI